MRRSGTKRRYWAVGVLALAALAFVGRVVWSGVTQATDPTFQERITMPGMSGTETFLVNLWVAPNPPKVGKVTLTIQVASIIGTPTELNAVSVHLARPDGSRTGEVDATRLATGENPKSGWSTVVDVDRPGAWQVVVHTDAGSGVLRDSTFAVTVQG